VDIGGVTVRLSAKPDRGPAFPKASSGLKGRIELGGLSMLEERTFSVVFHNARPPFLIRVGLESQWVTMEGPK